MTTEAAANLYLAQHQVEVEGRGVVIFNPKNREDIENLPVIMAFSNSSSGDGIAYAMAEDGHVLGSHFCSHEGYVPHDLGVLEGSRDDRHEHYRKHYPEGYRMRFIKINDVKTDETLTKAFELNQKLAIESNKGAL